MLASITPLGERGRQAHWGITLTVFALAASGAGLLAGLLAGSIGAAVTDGLGVHPRFALLGAAALAAVVLDAGVRGVPGPRRQVDERWLDEYRGWVYGLGYGAQLGLGITTVVTSAATYVMLLAAVLTGDPADGAVVVCCYGTIRGLTPLIAARVRAPAQLLALHAALARVQVAVARAGLVALAAVFMVAVAGSVA